MWELHLENLFQCLLHYLADEMALNLSNFSYFISKIEIIIATLQNQST